MAFELKNTVPWGRSLNEYIDMFSLSTADLNKTIISFGDGPASFNAEMTQLNRKVISFDPIYQFSKKELENQITETIPLVLEQTKNNRDNFIWTTISNIETLLEMRTSAMRKFIDDFESGKAEGRYIAHELPKRTRFKDAAFELGLSSHFLILYDQLGIDFHLSSITEMLRICKEVRIFPTLNLNAEKPAFLDDLIKHFDQKYKVTVQKVNYEFQKNGNEMLTIKRK